MPAPLDMPQIDAARQQEIFSQFRALQDQLMRLEQENQMLRSAMAVAPSSPEDALHAAAGAPDEVPAATPVSECTRSLWNLFGLLGC